MSRHDLPFLLPLMVPAASAVLVLLLIALRRSHALTAWVTLAGLAGCLAAVVRVAPLAPRPVTALLIVDQYALFFTGLIAAAAGAVVLLSWDYLAARRGNREEYYLLLLLATTGSAVLVASTHFASLFLALELLSVSLYGLIAYSRNNALSVEAGIKYLVLAGFSSAFLLLGMAFVYGSRGSLAFAEVRGGAAPTDPLLIGGLALILVGMGFKLALVPFHWWTPDVYQGAPAPVAGFIATVSKGAVFAVLLRFFAPWARFGPELQEVFALLAVASILVGNLLALRQRSLKRLLGYSSIAHMGYLLVAFLAGGRWAVTAAAFYLAAYFITNLAAFGVVALLSTPEREADDLEDYAGLAWRRPGPAAVLIAALLSLTGIPLTAGFVGKFYLMAAGVSAGLWLPVIALVVGSGIGLYYYLRVIIAVCREPEGGEARAVTAPVVGGAALAGLGLLLVWVGVYPGPLVELVQRIAERLY